MKEARNTTEKKVTLLITGKGTYSNTETSRIDFDSFVNMLFKEHKKQLNKLFKDIGDLRVKSAIKGVQFDSVDKDIRDFE